jgi:glycosyltransferase involved in cell wall biosynthesis
MKVLLVVPSVIKYGIDPQVACDVHPQMDYYALAHLLESRGANVDIVGYSSAKGSATQRDLSLAALAWRRSSAYDVIFSNGENVGLPLAMMLNALKHRPRHVMIGHRISSPKKQPFFKLLGARRAIDHIFFYSTVQRDYATRVLRTRPEKTTLMRFHVDEHFFRPMPWKREKRNLVSSAGLERRDYACLIEAARDLPHIAFSLAAASPWSKNRNKVGNSILPENVSAQSMTWRELRPLYADSFAIVVPVIETDFQAGITVILEGMAMGRPVIATNTSGRSESIIDGVTGIYVPPGDSKAMKMALTRLYDDQEYAETMGRKAREWILEYARQDQWASQIAAGILEY